MLDIIAYLRSMLFDYDPWEVAMYYVHNENIALYRKLCEQIHDPFPSVAQPTLALFMDADLQETFGT